MLASIEGVDAGAVRSPEQLVPIQLPGGDDDMIVVVSDFDGRQDYYSLGVYWRRRYGTTLVLSINRLTEGPYTA